MGKRDDNKQHKREQIVAAARALFAGDGYDATTTRAIAEAAGIGVGTLFLYAPTKPDVLWLLFGTDMGEVLDDALATLPGQAPLVDQLMHLFGAFFDFYLRDPRLGRAYVRELLALSPLYRVERQALEHRLFTAMARLLGERVADGTLRADLQPQIAIFACFSLYFSALNAWLSGEVTETMARPLLRAELTLLLEGAGKASGGVARRVSPAGPADGSPRTTPGGTRRPDGREHTDGC